MYVGSFCVAFRTFLGFESAICPMAIFSNACLVLSAVEMTCSSLGLSRLISPTFTRCRKGTKSLTCELFYWHRVLVEQ